MSRPFLVTQPHHSKFRGSFSHKTPIFGKSHRFASFALELPYRPNLLTKFYMVGLKLLSMTQGTTFPQYFLDFQIKGRLSPPKQQILEVILCRQKVKKSSIFNLSQFTTYLHQTTAFHVYINNHQLKGVEISKISGFGPSNANISIGLASLKQ